MTDIKFDNFNAFILTDCLHLLVKNLYSRTEECEGEYAKDYGSPLTAKNRLEISFALNELSKVLRYIDRDELCPNWKELEKGDAIDENGMRNLAVYGYHRKKSRILNYRDPRIVNDQT